MKSRIAFRMRGEEVEEIPLRHEGDELTPGGQMRKIGDRKLFASDLSIELTRFVMRQFQKLLEQSQLVHHLQRRGGEGIAAKVTQKIRVLFQHHNLHSCAG